MTTVFNVEPDSRLKTKYNFRKQTKALFYLKQMSVTETMKESQSNLLEKKNPTILKDNFSLKVDPTIFISTTTEFLHKSTKSCRSHWISEPKSSCCHK